MSADLARLIAIGLLLLGAAPAAPRAANSRVETGADRSTRAQAARSLFDRADLGRFASELGRTLREEAQTGGGALDPSEKEGFEHAVEQVTQPARLRTTALAAFAALYDERAAGNAGDWYGSEPGKRLLSMEARAAEVNWDRELDAFITALGENPASPKRLRLLRRLADASGAGEDAVTMQLGVARVLAVGLKTLHGRAEGSTSEKAQATWKRKEARLRARMSTQLAIVMLYVYRTASDEELLRYVEFAESPAASWLFDANRRAVGAVIERLQRDLARELSPH